MSTNQHKQVGVWKREKAFDRLKPFQGIGDINGDPSNAYPSRITLRSSGPTTMTSSEAKVDELCAALAVAHYS